MPWSTPTMAFILAGVLAAVTPTILRRLPLPPDEPDARPYVELGTSRFRVIVGLCSAAALTVGLATTEPELWATWSALATGGVLLAVIDAHTGLLPLRLTRVTWVLAAAGAMLASVLRGSAAPLAGALLGAGAAGGFFYLMWRFGGGLGFGDVRLVAVIGTVTGATSPTLTAWSLLLGGLAGVVWGFAARVRRGTDGPFPYGPALLSGPFLALGLSALTGG